MIVSVAGTSSQQIVEKVFVMTSSTNVLPHHPAGGNKLGPDGAALFAAQLQDTRLEALGLRSLPERRGLQRERCLF